MGQGPFQRARGQATRSGRPDRAGQPAQSAQPAQPSAARRASGQRRGLPTQSPGQRPVLPQPAPGRREPAHRPSNGRTADLGSQLRRRSGWRGRPDDAGATDLGSQVRRLRQRRSPPGARFAGGVVGELVRRAGDRPDAARLWGALIVGIVGALLLGVAGISDNYLHRGVETAANGPFVVQPTGHAPAANEDLLAVDPAGRGAVIDRMAASGIRYVRLPVRWAELETEPGAFAWDEFDATLTALDAAGITPVATIVDTPEWAQGDNTDAAVDTPPADPTDLYGFVQALMTKFSGRLPFLQIWDQPNDPAHWGGQTPDPVGYATLLGESANAARLASPEVRIVLAELAVAPASGPDDLDFLRAIYRSRAADFFDVVAIVTDGGDRSPFDRQVDASRINVSRAILARDVMVEEGDPTTPVWSTHFGWSSGPGGVTPAEQAEYTVAALGRMRAEWPWMGLAFLWDFSEQDGAGNDDAGRALVAGGQPTATLQAVSAVAPDLTALAPTGYTPLDAPAITLTGPWTTQAAAPQYQTSPEVGSTVEIRFDGSGLVANVLYGPNIGDVRVQLDGGPVPGLPPDESSDGTASLLDLTNVTAFEASQPVVTGLDPGPHTLTMQLASSGQLTVGGLVVVRDLPTLWPIVVLAVAGLVLLFFAVREVLYVLLLRRGYLRRRREVDLNPAGRR